MYAAYMKEIGRVCAEGRKKAGKSQQWLADQLGVSRSLVALFEAGGDDSAVLMLGYVDHNLISIDTLEDVLNGTI